VFSTLFIKLMPVVSSSVKRGGSFFSSLQEKKLVIAIKKQKITIHLFILMTTCSAS